MKDALTTLKEIAKSLDARLARVTRGDAELDTHAPAYNLFFTGKSDHAEGNLDRFVADALALGLRVDVLGPRDARVVTNHTYTQRHVAEGTVSF